MRPRIDIPRWDKLIQSPDWYIKIWPEFKQTYEQSQDTDYRNEVRDYFIDRLAHDRIALATSGDDLDQARQPIDTIVIHHTSNQTTYTLDRLNGVHLMNLYVPYYLDPHVPGEEHLKGTPIWSGHFNNGKQVFYAYHWMVRMDGTAERLLEDHQIGWQAGDWDTNCRSVAICLDNDYQDTEPSQPVLDAVIKIIKSHYDFMPKANIIGHLEVKPELKTTCPGGLFMSSWKQKIIQAV